MIPTHFTYSPKYKTRIQELPNSNLCSETSQVEMQHFYQEKHHSPTSKDKSTSIHSISPGEKMPVSEKDLPNVSLEDIPLQEIFSTKKKNTFWHRRVNTQANWARAQRLPHMPGGTVLPGIGQ